MTNEWAAVSELIAVAANGARRQVLLRIGIPQQLESADWACPVDIQGLELHPIEIFGIDSLQALGLGFAFAVRSCLAFEQAGGSFEFPDGEPISMADYLPHVQTSPVRPSNDR